MAEAMVRVVEATCSDCEYRVSALLLSAGGSLGETVTLPAVIPASELRGERWLHQGLCRGALSFVTEPVDEVGS
jgi:hypothetical protein